MLEATGVLLAVSSGVEAEPHLLQISDELLLGAIAVCKQGDVERWERRPGMGAQLGLLPSPDPALSLRNNLALPCSVLPRPASSGEPAAVLLQSASYRSSPTQLGLSFWVPKVQGPPFPQVSPALLHTHFSCGGRRRVSS